MKLNNMKCGGSCIVTDITGADKMRRRMLDMGITNGVKVDIVGIAPLGDPLILQLRGYKLSVRREDARNIDVKEL